MHPLLSQPSNQSASAGKLHLSKDEQVLRLSQQHTSDSGADPEEDSHGSFQHVFDIANDFNSVGGPVDALPNHPAKDNDQSNETTEVQADNPDFEGADPLEERVTLTDRPLNQNSVQLASDAPGSAAILGQTKHLPSGHRDLLNATQCTALSNADEARAVDPTALNTKSATDPHHITASVQSRTPTQTAHIFDHNKQSILPVADQGEQSVQLSEASLINARASQPSTAGSGTIGGIIVPGTGKDLENPAFTLPRITKPESPIQKSEQKASQIHFAGSAVHDGAAIKTVGMGDNDRLPNPERFEAANRPTLDRTALSSIKLIQNGPIQSIFWNAGAPRSASSQNLTLKASATESLALLPSEIAQAPTFQHGTVPVRAEMPAHIARQLAEVAQHLPSRPVEITLSPEELGRVRLSVVPSENGIVVNVLAERPETLDLLRRYIDQLAQEFQNLGYEDIGFSFSSAEQNTSDEQAEQPTEISGQTTSLDPDLDVVENTHIHLSNGATTGLDLRL